MDKEIKAKVAVDIDGLKDQMGKLRNIEKSLNEKMAKKEFRNELFKNPVTILKQEGIVIPKEKERAINEFFKSVTLPQEARLGVDLSSLETAAKAPAFAIFVVIRIPF
jgi:2'-5' RNA ligase